MQHVQKFDVATPVVTLEALEGRRLMSAALARGTLTVEGTDAADTIYLYQGVEPGEQRPMLFVQFMPDPPAGSVALLVRQSFPANAVRRVVVRGGTGDDEIRLGYLDASAAAGRSPISARSAIDGGDGNDSIVGGAGRDFMTGGAGDDYLAGYGGNDTIFGGDGDDGVVVSGGRDVVFGGAGNDFINAAGDHPGAATGLVADGGDGADRITGSRGRDRLLGGAGNDQIRGGGGNGADRIFGGDGDDSLDGNADPRTLVVGGPGRDTFAVTEEARPRIRDFDPDEDQLSFPILVPGPFF